MILMGFANKLFENTASAGHVLMTCGFFISDRRKTGLYSLASMNERISFLSRYEGERQ